MDPPWPSSKDQTRLFSRERWVSFPWTPRQVRRDAVRTYVVRGPLTHEHRVRTRVSRRAMVVRTAALAVLALIQGVQPSWPRSLTRTRDRIRDTCIWVTPISSAICAWVCCLKNRR